MGDNIVIVLLPEEKAPCFSLNTYRILKQRGVIDRIHATVQSNRNHTKMYRCNFRNLGTLEFTYDHPFVYNGKVYPFDKLMHIDPSITNVEEIAYDDKSVEMVYNIIGYPIQLDKRNLFKIDDDLYMVGGKYSEKLGVTPEYFEKKMEVLNKISQNPEHSAYIRERYGGVN
jgi:hypothetical protein